MNDLETLTERIRLLLADDPNIGEKKMFGGVCFLLNGNMLCSASKTGNLMVRVGADREVEARGKPHTADMNFTGKPMKGFIYVEPDGIKTDKELYYWVAFATKFVGTLPAK